MSRLLSNSESSFRLPIDFLPVDITPASKKLICCLHRHTTEIRHEVSAIRMAGDIAFCAFASILTTERKHVTTVATPIGTNVCQRLKTMRDTMINFLFVSIL